MINRYMYKRSLSHGTMTTLSQQSPTHREKNIYWKVSVSFVSVCLVLINVSREFVDMACDFLNCNEGFISLSFWVYLLEKIRENFGLGFRCYFLDQLQSRLNTREGRKSILILVVGVVFMFSTFLTWSYRLGGGGIRGGRKICLVKRKMVTNEVCGCKSC